MVKSDPRESPKRTETLHKRDLDNNNLEPLNTDISHHCGYSCPLTVLPIFKNRRITPQFHPNRYKPAFFLELGKEIGANAGHRRITWSSQT